MVYEGEQQGAEVVVRKLIGTAVLKQFQKSFPEVGREAGSGGEEDSGPYAEILRWFAAGNEVTVSDEQAFADYERELARVPDLLDLAAPHAGCRQERAFWAEVALEGLHQSVKLARHDLDSTVSYREMLRFQLLKPPKRSGPRRGEVH
jgi:magnesium chelatase subunit I